MDTLHKGSHEGPDTAEVKKILKDIGGWDRYPTRWRHSIVDEVVDMEEIKRDLWAGPGWSWPSEIWGSWEGYYKFIHYLLVEKCTVKLNERLQAVAKIAKFLEKYWVADRLYRPPTENLPAGLRYRSVESEYYETTKRLAEACSPISAQTKSN